MLSSSRSMAERRACTACMRDMGVRGSACVQEHIKRRAGRIVQRIELRALRIVETQRLRDLLDGPGGDRAAWLVNGPLLWCRHGRIGAYRRIAKNALVEIRIGVRPEVVVGIGIQGVIENVPGSIGPEQRAAPQSAARTEMRVSSCKKNAQTAAQIACSGACAVRRPGVQRRSDYPATRGYFVWTQSPIRNSVLRVRGKCAASLTRTPAMQARLKQADPIGTAECQVTEACAGLGIQAAGSRFAALCDARRWAA
jgi:hypothetical protein